MNSRSGKQNNTGPATAGSCNIKLGIALGLAIAIGGSRLLIAQGSPDSVDKESEEEVEKPFKHKLAADFGQCPDGHKALKDIPIVYGHVGPLYKKPEEFNDNDRELVKRRDKGEIVFGGDLLYEHSPKSQVVCQKCGFRYRPSELPVMFPEASFWSKNSSKPEDFKIKFSQKLLSFPLMGAEKGKVSYSQILSPDGRKIDMESISFQTALPIEKALKTTHDWMKKNDYDPEELKRIKEAFAHHSYSFDTDSISISLMDDTFWEPGKISVSLILTNVKE